LAQLLMMGDHRPGGRLPECYKPKPNFLSIDILMEGNGGDYGGLAEIYANQSDF
jgi:hypothetical protein